MDSYTVHSMYFMSASNSQHFFAFSFTTHSFQLCSINRYEILRNPLQFAAMLVRFGSVEAHGLSRIVSTTTHRSTASAQCFGAGDEDGQVDCRALGRA